MNWISHYILYRMKRKKIEKEMNKESSSRAEPSRACVCCNVPYTLDLDCAPSGRECLDCVITKKKTYFEWFHWNSTTPMYTETEKERLREGERKRFHHFHILCWFCIRKTIQCAHTQVLTVLQVIVCVCICDRGHWAMYRAC